MTPPTTYLALLFNHSQRCRTLIHVVDISDLQLRAESIYLHVLLLCLLRHWEEVKEESKP